MFVAAIVGLLVSMLFALVRAFLGPTIYDTILSVNVFGTKTVLLIAVFGFLMGRPDFLDIALVYALINFVGVVAVARLAQSLLRDKVAMLIACVCDSQWDC
ncbi:MAG: pH regulation protein F [Alteromonadaceae bacterium]|nr:MAG: pH regulation protein F [Alteromonadaceae bacterium]